MGKLFKLLSGTAFIRVVLIVAIVSIAYGVHVYYQRQMNLLGVCHKRGKVLSVEERIDVIFKKLNEDVVRTNNFKRFARNQYRSDFRKEIPLKNYTISQFARDGSKIKISIYPDIPDTAIDGDGRFISYWGIHSWEPVTNYYKASGYAFDLVFSDVNLLLVGENKQELRVSGSFRLWTNSCGESVEMPEEYKVG